MGGRNLLLTGSGGGGLPIVLPSAVTGLRAWWKADAIVGKNNGDAISSWVSSDSNAWDAAQATAAKQPTYRTNVKNGKPAVRFDGTDDLLVVTPNTPLTTANSGAVFVVYQPLEEAAGFVFGSYDTAVAGRWWNLYGAVGAGAHDVWIYARDSGATITHPMSSPQASNLAPPNAVHGHLFHSNGTTTGYERNETVYTPEALSDPDSGRWANDINRTNFVLGGGISDAGELGQHNVDILELIIYDGTDWEAKKAGLWTYLKDKYAL